MDYVLTQHARIALAERRISEAWLERALEVPEHTVPDPDDPELEHRIRRIEEHGNRALRVVVTRGTDPRRIITAFFDRRLRDAL